MELVRGTRLGRYTIESLLGKGGMGEVYRAQDPELGRDVAIKILPDRFANNAESVARFQREAKAIATLSHPNILAIFDIGKQDDVLFAVMELLEGETLRNRIASSILGWRKAAQIGASIAEGLAVAHSKGIIHRDLKPENIFLTSDKRVKILDFGLARLIPVVSAQDVTEAPTRDVETKVGTVFGTIPYMSPEQVRGMPVDAATDIFSFGSVLYEMVSGQKAFYRNSEAETIAAILKEDPPKVGSGETIPHGLWQIISRCLEKSPESRFPSAHDLILALKSIEIESSRPIAATEGSKPSIAVLPFVDMSAEKDQEYFCDGLAEELITALTKLEGLRVASRASAFQFTGKGQDLERIGKQLHVDTVLLGSVRKSGIKLRISAQLVKTDGDPLWSEKFDRQVEDIFAIQDEIAQSIVDTLKVRFLRKDTPLLKRYTEDHEAHSVYLKGRYFWNKRYQVGLQKGIDYFHQAIEKDPGYALAYSGLADSYTVLGFYGNMDANEARSRAKAAALKALQLDDSCAEAHTSLGFIYNWFDWNLPDAEREFQRSIELNPNDADAHSWYGISVAAFGRFDCAEREAKKAVEIQPLSFTVGPGLGFVYQMARRYDEAIQECRKTLDLEPNSQLALWIIGISYCHKFIYEESIAALQKAFRITGDSFFLGILGYVYAKFSKKTEALDVLQELEARSKSNFVAPVFFAWINGALGELNIAFDYMEKAFAQKHPLLAALHVWEIYDSLRADPRFAKYASQVPV